MTVGAKRRHSGWHETQEEPASCAAPSAHGKLFQDLILTCGVEGASPDLAGRFHPLGLQMEGLRPMGVGRGPGHPGRAGARGGHRQDS